MSDDYEYNHKFENYVQKQVQEARQESKKITKVVIAKIDDDSDVGVHQQSPFFGIPL